jgi:hypothetical protein
MEKYEIKAGHWDHLSDISTNCYKGSETNPYYVFEYWFERYNKAVIIQEIRWNKYCDEPYVIVKNLGCYTNLNDLARRIKTELYDLSGGSKTFDHKKLSLRADTYGDFLEIRINEIDGIEYKITPISLDDTSNLTIDEGLKFELDKRKIRTERIDQILST